MKCSNCGFEIKNQKSPNPKLAEILSLIEGKKEETKSNKKDFVEFCPGQKTFNKKRKTTKWLYDDSFDHARY